MSRRAINIFLLFSFISIISITCIAQDIAPPVPQRLVIHSNVLNEDRVIWVRMPTTGPGGRGSYPVLYITDGGSNVNEIGSLIDFLVDNNRIPPLMVVGIANTDRIRDLTPTHADMKRPDGTSDPGVTTSGGSDKFLDFIQSELIPEIEKRYATLPFRIFAGHSLGGLLTIHALITRPDLFNAYLAVSPSLQWDDAHTLHQAQQFFAKQKDLKKTLFFSLGNEGETPNPMGEAFEQMQKTLSTNLPKGFVVQSARYRDEDHGSTVLVAHYAGLRTIFGGWQMPRDMQTGLPVGGLAGVEKHYRELSDRYGFPVSAEQGINSLGYALLGRNKASEAVIAFKRNVELYPKSANVYDSLADGLEAAGQAEPAMQNVQKAVAVGTDSSDPLLPEFKKHLERLTAAAKAGKGDQAK